jgi:hypothetical protein
MQRQNTQSMPTTSPDPTGSRRNSPPGPQTVRRPGARPGTKHVARRPPVRPPAGQTQYAATCVRPARPLRGRSELHVPAAAAGNARLHRPPGPSGAWSRSTPRRTGTTPEATAAATRRGPCRPSTGSTPQSPGDVSWGGRCGGGSRWRAERGGPSKSNGTSMTCWMPFSGRMHGGGTAHCGNCR